MKALVYTAPMTLEVREEPEPEPGPDEVLVEVHAVGICGSELEGVLSQSPFRVPPLIMGHEFYGRRQDDGTFVTVNPVVSCGACDLCCRGLPNVCRHREIVGIQRPGGFAELVVVPQRNCVSIDTLGSVPERWALTEPMANAIHAVRLLFERDSMPLHVGIVGAGMLGLGVGLALQAKGVPDVEIVDMSDERASLSQRVGLAARERLTGEFDAIFDTVGTAQTRGLSVRLIRPGGFAIWLGLHAAGVELDCQALIRSEKHVLTTFCYSGSDFAGAANIVPTLPSGLTRDVSLAAGADAFMSLMTHTSPVPRTLLRPLG